MDNVVLVVESRCFVKQSLILYLPREVHIIFVSETNIKNETIDWLMDYSMTRI